MSQLGDYEDLIQDLEENLHRRGVGQELSVDADHILKSFGMMKCMDFVFDVFDESSDSYIADWKTDYPLVSAYMTKLNPYIQLFIGCVF